MEISKLSAYIQRILGGGEITPEEALELLTVNDEDTPLLAALPIKYDNIFAVTMSIAALLPQPGPVNAQKTAVSVPNRHSITQISPFFLLFLQKKLSLAPARPRLPGPLAFQSSREVVLSNRAPTLKIL